MVITDETVEERNQRLSGEADRADKLARKLKTKLKNVSQTTKKRKTKTSSKSNNFSSKRRRSAMPGL